MSSNSSATLAGSHAIPGSHRGLWWGLLGVTGFSLTVPLTRILVQDGAMSPLFVGAGRAVVATVFAVIALSLTRQPRPRGRQWRSVAVVAGGVVVGFPLLTSYALTTASASHASVVIAVLPAATAAVAVLRTGERPTPAFWWAAGAGAVAAVGFAALHGGGDFGLGGADLVLLASVVVCAAGYAEGGLLSRTLGSWQTISWGLVFASPLMVVLAGIAVVRQPVDATPGQWAAFGYVSAVSMFLGLLVWYRALAIGPMAQVSQVQLAQPVLSILWAALLLSEQVTLPTVLGGAVVIGCALLAVRARSRPAPVSAGSAPSGVGEASGADVSLQGAART